MLLWSFHPDWTDEVRVSFEFKTEVIPSRSNLEQRLAERAVPRVSMEFSCAVADSAYRALSAALMAKMDDSVSMPFWPRGLLLSGSYGAGTSTVLTVDTDTWLQGGVQVVLIWGDPEKSFSETKTVNTVTGNTVVFTSPLSNDIPPDAVIYALWTGRIEASMDVRHKSDTVASLKVSFAVDPGFEQIGSLPAIPSSYNGRELVSFRPDWSKDISHTYMALIETVDYGYGRVAHNSPVTFNDRVVSLSYFTDSRAETDLILNSFRRQSGQQGEFFMPTFVADMRLFATGSIGDTSLRIVGTEVSDYFFASETYQHFSIVYADGTITCHEMTSVEVISDTAGLNDKLHFTPALSKSTTRNTIDMISWLPLWRFASDQMIVQWITDQNAMIGVTCKTLKVLAAES